MRVFIYLIIVILFSSCFLIRKKYVKFYNQNLPPDNISRYSLNDYDLYVFSMEEIQESLDEKDSTTVNKRYINSVDGKGNYVVEEIYLFVEKDTTKEKRKIWYLTTFYNQFVTNSVLNQFDSDGYQYYYHLNTPLHKKAIIINELDFLIPGEMKNDTISIKQNSLVSYNHIDELKMTFSRTRKGSNELIELNTINDDSRRHKDPKKRFKINDVLGANMKFKSSNRKLAYVAIGEKKLQYSDIFYTTDCDFYFQKAHKDSFDTKSYGFQKYLWFKGRYLNEKNDCKATN